MHSPDLHAPQTTSHLASLLLAPINAYASVLTLLALARYVSLLALQPASTRRSLAHAVVSSILRNETIVDTPEDVNGVLELCQVLIRDTDSTFANNTTSPSVGLGTAPGAGTQRRPPYMVDREEMAEEQGWVARMVHLFRSDSLDVQFEVFPVSLALEVRLTYTIPASSISEKTLRTWWRAYAFHIPGAHHERH